MKIAYVGDKDKLANIIIERLTQEGDDVFLLSSKKSSAKRTSKKKYRFYHIPKNEESYRQLITSIGADCVIFAGSNYLKNDMAKVSEDDLSLLRMTLESVSSFKETKFILLSSTDVYSNKISGQHLSFANENQKLHPTNDRGLIFYNKEALAENLARVLNLKLIILRASQLYFDSFLVENNKDDGFLSDLYADIINYKDTVCVNQAYQPLNGRDFADAVKRAIYEGTAPVYNVCSPHAVFKNELFELICNASGVKKPDLKWADPKYDRLADPSFIKESLGWKNFKNLPDQIKNGEIKFAPTVLEKASKRKKFPVHVRQFIENILLFAAFFAAAYFTLDVGVFSNINWLLIYVVITAVTYSPAHTAVGILLAAAGYLYCRHFNLLQINNFYTFTDSIIVIMEFVFIGFIVSYTVNSLKEEKQFIESDIATLREDYEDLKKINEENVLIKNEYEKRLLNAEDGFPKLYSIISRLLVQDVDRILMEIMNIISNMMHTDTVAVYRVEEGSPYLRLINALNENSAQPGKSWNISGSPNIYNAVKKGELYRGALGTDEPALLLPIKSRGNTQAVILIKKLPFESESQYHINLLKTLSLLLGDSIEKALAYEDLAKQNNYIENTDILTPAAFKQRIELAKEKADNFGSEYLALKLKYHGDMREVAKKMDGLLRITDYLGISDSGDLLALFNNTGVSDLEILKKKLLSMGVDAEVA